MGVFERAVRRIIGASNPEAPRGKRAKAKIAIIQFESVHEEVIPSVARALQRCGVDYEIYVNANVCLRRGDLLGGIPETKGRVHYPDINTRKDWDNLLAVVKRENYDALFLNTFQREGVANWAERANLPILGIVHNPKMFMAQPKCVSLLASGQASVFSLAPHVSEWMRSHSRKLFAKVGTLSHNFWSLQSVQKPACGQGGTRRIVIPGSVNFASRDYISVVRSLPGLIEQAEESLEIGIVGGGPDRDRLEGLVEELNCANHVRFASIDPATGFVDNSTYFSALGRADFILPMLPEKRVDYRTFKLTSAVPTSVGFCIPAILDDWTERVYEAPCVSYERGEFLRGLKHAALMSRVDVNALEEKLSDFRDNLETRCFTEMKKGLEQVSII